MSGSGTGRSRQRLLLLVGALGVCLAAVWYFARRSQDEAPAPVADEPAAPAAETPALPPLPPAARRPQPPPPETPKEQTITSDGLPVAPAHGDVNGQAHPHPITPQHQRIFGENRLVAALDGAMEVKDVAGMRRLLEQYRREYPEDDNELQDGYGLIADCFEHPGAAARAAAEQWLDSHNGSTLKRFVNRHCLNVE